MPSIVTELRIVLAGEFSLPLSVVMGLLLFRGIFF